MAKRIIGDDIARFWSKVDRSGPNQCWNWTAARTDKGYGNFYLGGRYYSAHRVSYEWEVGSIADGLEIDHLCRNRSCVNPAHLEPVSHRENDLRGIGVSATNVLKTHRPRGHPYDEVNTYLRPRTANARGVRDCRICKRAANLRVRRQPAAWRRQAAG